ncbi:hypothetical protein K503DRAFT_62241 [Rhizopogon vinicolor AM-OR11-026]|uniref:Uncharacterized protein n=1 Tax=Rhizopogon vinicolor AM-OR11-026 TaxID=1314800 RepID=A0A1B7MGC8_9AGAM|nr:hypothetical protein K503DRAFT_62241 [Rhizopogon vinicolor AM-OR11-026]
MVNVPPFDNVHTTSVFAAKKGRASGAKTGGKCKCVLAQLKMGGELAQQREYDMDAANLLATDTWNKTVCDARYTSPLNVCFQRVF